MKKNIWLLIISIVAACGPTLAQSDQHHTMFMYNKLLYNPGYTGSREMVSGMLTYRRQWRAIDGAPRSLTLSADGPIGSYMRPVRKLAAGFSMSSERNGPLINNNLRAYYAYRLPLKSSVLSLGLSGGCNFYTAQLTGVSVPNPNDPAFSRNIEKVPLPNCGMGAYWSSKDFYAGLSVPNMMQNYYDKERGKLAAKQIRAYYACGGYSFAANEDISIQPQMLLRYAMNGKYSLPPSADINVSAIAYNRFMVGLTYRTDKSIEGIVHLQVSKTFNFGYAYDHVVSALNGYTGGTHEISLGYDFVRDNFQFLTPRFIRKF